jgi:hypothetical protein
LPDSAGQTDICPEDNLFLEKAAAAAKEIRLNIGGEEVEQSVILVQ